MARLAKANPDDLTALSGIGEKSAERIIEAAQAFLAKKSEGVGSPPDEDVLPEAADAPVPVNDGNPEPEARETL